MANNSNKKTRLEDEILPTAFFMHCIIGFWWRDDWSNKKKLLYFLYTVYTIFVLVGVSATELLYIYFNLENFSDALVNDICMVVTRCNGLMRMLVFMFRRDQIVRLIEACTEKRWYEIQDEDEAAIKEKYKISMRNVVFSCTALVMTTGVTKVLRKNLGKDGHFELNLPMNAWYPFDLQVPHFFWMAFVHQVLSTFPVAIGLAANACLVVGFMMQICVQLKILQCRILKLPTIIRKKRDLGLPLASLHVLEKNLIVECIYAHKSIVRLAAHFNDTFAWLQFILFFLTMMVSCTAIFQLSQQSSINTGTIMIIVFFLWALLPIFLYCWYGNEIIRNSMELTNAIFNMDWTELRFDSRKICLMMMTSMSKPIKISGGPMIVWDLNGFIKILKASYSAFNLLQHTST